MNVTINIHPGSFEVEFFPEAPKPFTTIRMADKGVRADVFLRTPADCDELIKAVVEAKRLLLGEAEAPPPFQAEPAEPVETDGWYMTEP